MFNCDLDFPHETPIPYILQWNRDVSPPEFSKTRKQGGGRGVEKRNTKKKEISLRNVSIHLNQLRNKNATNDRPRRCFLSICLPADSLLRFPAEIRDLDARLDVSYDVKEGEGGRKTYLFFSFFFSPRHHRWTDGRTDGRRLTRPDRSRLRLKP